VLHHHAGHPWCIRTPNNFIEKQNNTEKRTKKTTESVSDTDTYTERVNIKERSDVTAGTIHIDKLRIKLQTPFLYCVRLQY